MGFTLRLFREIRDDSITTVTKAEQLCETVHYIPLDLDKESPDFVKQLEYLNVPFTFQRPQLPLFITQMYAKMQGNDENASEEVDRSMEEDA